MGTFTAKDLPESLRREVGKPAQHPGIDGPPFKGFFLSRFSLSRGLSVFSGDHIDSQLRH